MDTKLPVNPLVVMEMENSQLANLNGEEQKEIEKKLGAPAKDAKNGRERKKDDKNIEQLIKSLNGLLTPDEKLNAMCKKYFEVIDENRRLQATLKQSEKSRAIILREKDQCQTEKSKAVLAKSRLENLCRELQRQNKAVKEESLLKIREEEEKRKEVSAKFQSTLAEITQLMAETNEKNVKLHEDNIEIHKKFKSVFDEMDIREQHFEGMHQMMKHELQVADVKLNKVTVEMSEEKESLLKDKNTLLLKLAEYQKRIHQLQTVEANLRSQVEMYTSKYEEFQAALAKSNKVFGGFNTEMDKMSKKIVKLEKETCMWKLRWEKSQSTLLEMASDKQTRDADILKLNKKCSLLQELCKTFQQERASLISQLKEKSGCGEINSESRDEINQKETPAARNQSPTSGMVEADLSVKMNTVMIDEAKESKTVVECPNTDLIVKSIPTEVDNEVSDDKDNANSEKSETTDNIGLHQDSLKMSDESSVKLKDNETNVLNIHDLTQEETSQSVDGETLSSNVADPKSVTSSEINTEIENTQLIPNPMASTVQAKIDMEQLEKQVLDSVKQQDNVELSIECDTLNVNIEPKAEGNSQSDDSNKKYKEVKKKRK